MARPGFNADSGIERLMADLGASLSGGHDAMLMLGGGNPPVLPGVSAWLKARLAALSPSDVANAFQCYDEPKGEPVFMTALAAYLSDAFGADIAPSDIVLTNGSQQAFFALFQHLGATCPIVFPRLPEYIGYDGLSPAGITSYMPRIIEHTADNGAVPTFEYAIDMDALNLSHAGAVCISSPSNPSGHVVAHEELAALDRMADAAGIPLILDAAYGYPFPNLVFNETAPYFSDNTILCLSLSKLGLPALRTGMVITKRRDIIRALTTFNAIANLAPASVGAVLVKPLLETGAMTAWLNDNLAPFYTTKRQRAWQAANTALAPIPKARLHTVQGSMFLWLWCKDLPITSLALYARLKEAGVLTVAGEYFFPGTIAGTDAAHDWFVAHRTECMRLNYANVDDAAFVKAMQRTAQVLHEVYHHGQ